MMPVKLEPTVCKGKILSLSYFLSLKKSVQGRYLMCLFAFSHQQLFVLEWTKSQASRNFTTLFPLFLFFSIEGNKRRKWPIEPFGLQHASELTLLYLKKKNHCSFQISHNQTLFLQLCSHNRQPVWCWNQAMLTSHQRWAREKLVCRIPGMSVADNQMLSMQGAQFMEFKASPTSSDQFVYYGRALWRQKCHLV